MDRLPPDFTILKTNPYIFYQLPYLRGILIYLILSQQSIIVGKLTRCYKVLFKVYYITCIVILLIKRIQ